MHLLLYFLLAKAHSLRENVVELMRSCYGNSQLTARRIAPNVGSDMSVHSSAITRTIRSRTFPQREEHGMFEALFRIVAQVESNEQGQRVFHVSKHEAPPSESAFSFFVATVYQQEGY